MRRNRLIALGVVLVIVFGLIQTVPAAEGPHRPVARMHRHEAVEEWRRAPVVFPGALRSMIGKEDLESARERLEAMLAAVEIKEQFIDRFEELRAELSAVQEGIRELWQAEEIDRDQLLVLTEHGIDLLLALRDIQREMQNALVEVDSTLTKQLPGVSALCPKLRAETGYRSLTKRPAGHRFAHPKSK